MHTAVNLINGLESESIECRQACLSSLNKLKPQHGIDEETIKIEDALAHRVYTSRHSSDKSLAKIAKNVMSNLDLFPADDSVTRLTNDASCGVVHLQSQEHGIYIFLNKNSHIGSIKFYRFKQP